MAIVRVTGVDVSTGKERKIVAGDTIENLTISGLAMTFKGAIDGAAFPWPDEATARDNGDTYTITAATPITDPEGASQEVQPGDEIVWDESNGWWVVIGNADEGNVKSALLQVLLADEDLLLRRGGDINPLNVGANGNVLQVAGGQVAWGGVGNPLLGILTANEDLAIRRADAATRLPIGAEGNVLTVSGGQASWAAPAGGGGGMPKLSVHWYVDAENGDDVAGDGSPASPYQTLQKTVNEAHQHDETVALAVHHIHAKGDFRNLAEPLWIGAYDNGVSGGALGSWSNNGDTYEYGFFLIDGEFDRQFDDMSALWEPQPCMLGPVVMNMENAGNGSLVFKGCQLYTGVIAETQAFPALWVLNGRVGFINAEALNANDDSVNVIKLGSAWSPTIQAPWTASVGEWSWSLYGIESKFIQGFAPGYQTIYNQADSTASAPDDAAFTLHRCWAENSDDEVIYLRPCPSTGGSPDEPLFNNDVAHAKITDCEIYGADFFITGPVPVILWYFTSIVFRDNEVFGTYSVPCFSAAHRDTMDCFDNHFHWYGQVTQPQTAPAISLVPGEVMVTVWTLAYLWIDGLGQNICPANVYYGNNLNIAMTPIYGGNFAQHAQVEVTSATSFAGPGVDLPSYAWAGFVFTTGHVQRQVYDRASGWTTPLISFAAGGFVDITVVGNGAAHPNYPLFNFFQQGEPMPFEVLRDAGGGAYAKPAIMSAAAAAAPGQDAISVQYLASPDANFHTLRITNLDSASGVDLYFIMPGAVLIHGTAP